MIAVTESDVILVLVGIIQIIVIGLGVWILHTLVAILKVLEKLKTVAGVHGSSIKNLKDFRTYAESKLKELWSWYRRTLSQDGIPRVDPDED